MPEVFESLANTCGQGHLPPCPFRLVPASIEVFPELMGCEAVTALSLQSQMLFKSMKGYSAFHNDLQNF